MITIACLLDKQRILGISSTEIYEALSQYAERVLPIQDWAVIALIQNQNRTGMTSTALIDLMSVCMHGEMNSATDQESEINVRNGAVSRWRAVRRTIEELLHKRMHETLV